MSHEATTWAWKAFAGHQDLAATRRIVLLALAECHNGQTGRCDPSLARLHEMTGMKPHTISPSIRDLEAAGLIVVERAFGKGSSYQLAIKTYAENGTSAEMGTSAENGITPMPKTAQVPMPKTAYKPGNEPGRNQESIVVGDARASRTENKRPSGASEGGDGPHNGEPAKQAKRKASSKVPMTDDWMPDADLWDDIAKLAIDRGFAESLLPEFRRYWREDRAGEIRPGWNRTFLSHVQRNWKREMERPAGGTNVTPLRKGAVFNGPANFRTLGEMRAERNIQIAKEWVNETSERCIND